MIREPANTWSNVGFFLAAVAMLRLAPTAPRLIRRFAFVCIFMGIGSALFHATGTRAGGLLDSAGMQGVAAFMLAANARRLFPAPTARKTTRRDALCFWVVASVGTLLATAFEQHARSLFAIEVTIAGVMELAIVSRTRLQPAHRWLAFSWVTFAAAYLLWFADLHRIGCNASAHVWNGHAAWHLLMAASLFCFQRFHVLLGPTGTRIAPVDEACPRSSTATST